MPMCLCEGNMVFHKIIREQYGALVQYESNMVQYESNLALYGIIREQYGAI